MVQVYISPRNWDGSIIDLNDCNCIVVEVEMKHYYIYMSPSFYICIDNGSQVTAINGCFVAAIDLVDCHRGESKYLAVSYSKLSK